MSQDIYQAYDINGALVAECKSYLDMVSVLREQFHSITVDTYRNGVNNPNGYLRVTPQRTRLVKEIG